jgi:hypothetical protein
MHMPTKYFTDKLRAAFRFFRRPAFKTEAAEPDRADGPFGTMNWLSPPSGVARTREEALGAASEAPRQQAMQADQPLN